MNDLIKLKYELCDHGRGWKLERLPSFVKIVVKIGLACLGIVSEALLSVTCVCKN